MLFRLTVNASDVAGTLTNYPAYVDLSEMPSEFWSSVVNGGGDIRCWSDEAMTTQLAREVVFCNTSTDQGELHVKIPSLTTSTVIYISTDGSSSEPAADSTYGSEAVWSDYEAVYHMQQDPNGDASNAVRDSTDNDRHLTPSGSMTTGDSVAGQMGQAIDFDGTNDYLSGVGANITGAHTAQAWIYPHGSANYDVIVDSQPSAGTENNQYNLFLDNSSKFNSYGAGFVTSVTSISLNTWQAIAVTFESGTYRLYYNGGLDLTTSVSKPSVTTSIFRVGARASSTHTYDGLIDEVRVRADRPGDAWFETEYNNHSAPDTFWSVEAIAPVELETDLIKVAQATVVEKGLVYEIQTTETELIQKSLEYQVVSSDSVTKSLKYVVFSDLSVTKSLQYQVVTTPAAVEKVLEYQVVAPESVTKGLVYTVKAQDAVTKSLQYTVVTTAAPLEVSLQYVISDKAYTRYSYDDLPTDDENLTTRYTNDEIDDVSTDNGVRISQSALGPSENVIHQYKKRYDTPPSTNLVVRWNGQTTEVAPSDSEVFLQIYNYDSEEWETLDSNNSESAGVDFDLEGVVSVSLEDYFEDNWVAVRVYQEQ